VTRAARRGVRGRASIKAADGNHLIPRPSSNGEGAGAAAQNRVGAVVERLKGWNQAAPMNPDEGVGEQLGWQLAGQLGARNSVVTGQAAFNKIPEIRKSLFGKLTLFT
jgi:hypothetical protein